MKEYFKVNVNKYDETKCFDVVHPASLDRPQNNSVMFITEKYMNQADALQTVKDCLIFWPKNIIDIPEKVLQQNAVVLCEKPHKEYCRFFQDNEITNIPRPETMNCTNGAWIASGATLGQNVTIMPGAYVGGDCTIGDDVYIGSGTKILGEVFIGNNVVIRENTVIGADGLSTDRDMDGRAITMPQFGTVVLEDDVQVGAGVIIARGAIDETRICRGAKIDNGAFISHNVHIGEDTFVVGETIFFGSSSAGCRCLISGNSTIMNMVHIGDDSIVGAGAVVVKSVNEKTVVKGNPAK